ncbi:hypothetical protein [Nocardioides bruguierae]|uniref:Uncharacterized protein n=1 Tax=Nocardioides bruguierae TaxID=2945102 RepID=A0A9X2IHE1_9ACTN|nr:hypothetical protein [Nocardioides bruguierae]MCM0622509.1 hypothetical protein [Nocardioides bruguierae]
MSGLIRYDRNSAGIQVLLESPAMAAAMTARATAGLTVFQAIAPRVSNRYAESGHVTTGTDSYPTSRAAAHIVADVAYARAVERRHHTLARVADTIAPGR